MHRIHNSEFTDRGTWRSELRWPYPRLERPGLELLEPLKDRGYHVVGELARADKYGSLNDVMCAYTCEIMICLLDVAQGMCSRITTSKRICVYGGIISGKEL